MSQSTEVSAETDPEPLGGGTAVHEGFLGYWRSTLSGVRKGDLGSLPVVILYSFFVEHYVSSMTGAVKE